MKKCIALILALALSMLAAAGSAEESSEVETWNIWGEQMATEPEAGEYTFEKANDPADFRPTITPLFAGGSDLSEGQHAGGLRWRRPGRNNLAEGIPACEFLNSIGYNAYLVDYRVSP